MRHAGSSICVALAALLWLGAQPHSLAQASVMDLGTLGGTMSSGSKVNSRGEVIGASTTANGETHAFLYDSSGMRLLGLGGMYSVANDINNSGVVVGGSFLPGDNEFQAFVCVNGNMRTLSLGGTDGMALDVNENGQVVGYSSLPGDSETHAFLYDVVSDQMTDLNTLGGTSSYATALNESGQVIGFSYITGDAGTQAFRYSNGNMLALTLGGGSFANAINAHGEVVGTSGIPGSSDYHAFWYDGTQIVDLVGLGGSNSDAVGINDQGAIVGKSQLAGDAATSAFLFENNQMTPLSLGGGSSMAIGINNNGDVLGESFTAGDASYLAFIFRAGQYTELSLGGRFCYGLDLNELGEAVGIGTQPGSADFVAYRYTSAGIESLTLGGPSSSAWDIGDNGAVTGDSLTDHGEQHAFLVTGGPGTGPDTIPPTTVLTSDPEPNSAGWYRNAVMVTLTATDNDGGSGVKQITYWINSEAPETTAGDSVTFRLFPEGINTVTYFAEDNAGNVEEAKQTVFRIDKTEPKVSIAADPSILRPANGKLVNVKVTGRICDRLSGIARAWYEVVDEYSEIEPHGEITLGENGRYCFALFLRAYRNGKDSEGRWYKVKVFAYDVAGNLSISYAIITVPHN